MESNLHQTMQLTVIQPSPDEKAVGATTLGTQLVEIQSVAFFFYPSCTTNAPRTICTTQNNTPSGEFSRRGIAFLGSLPYSLVSLAWARTLFLNKHLPGAGTAASLSFYIPFLFKLVQLPLDSILRNSRNGGQLIHRSQRVIHQRVNNQL